jgi:hypothetical protein
LIRASAEIRKARKKRGGRSFIATRLIGGNGAVKNFEVKNIQARLQNALYFAFYSIETIKWL